MMPVPANQPLWYRDAVFYQLHVKTFCDSDGDGVGDFRGLTSKLDYLAALGVDCLWLLPTFPSPFRDDGYDIADYYNIHPGYGTLEDFRAFLEAAHARGLQVITELVTQSHLRPASVVPGGAQLDRQPAPRLVRVERHRRPLPRRPHHLPRHRVVQLGVGSGVEGLLLAPLLQPSAGPELRQPGGARGDVERHAVLAGHGRRRLPRRRRALPDRA